MPQYGSIDAALEGLLVTGEDFIDTGICGDTAGIGFGKPVFAAEGLDNLVFNAKADVLTFVLSAAFVTGNTIAGSVNGTAYSVAFAADDATTFANLVAAINLIPGTVAVGVFAARTIVITTAGTSASASGTVTGGASQATVTVTASAAAHLVGVSIRTAKEYAGSGQYFKGEAVGFVRIGKVWVTVGAAVLSSQPAFLDASTGAWTNVSSGNVATPYYFRTSASAGGLALLDVTKSPAALNG